MKNLVNWVEIPALDIKRSIDFYAKILDIQFHEFEMMGLNYALFPSEDPRNSGALVEGPHYKPSPDGISIYLDGGADLEKILEKVETAGGKVLMGKTYLSQEAGYIGFFLDTEGNKIGLQHL